MIFVKFSQCFEKSQQLGLAKVTKNVSGISNTDETLESAVTVCHVSDCEIVVIDNEWIFKINEEVVDLLTRFGSLYTGGLSWA